MSETKRDEDRDAAVIAFYNQQWRDIHDSDVLDWRIMTVLLTVIAAFSAVIGIQLGEQGQSPQTAQQPSLLPLFPSVSVLLGLIALTLAFYGMWMTLRSYHVLQLKMESITRAEKQMRVDDLAPQTFKKAETAGQFLSAFAVSRRFPLFVAYFLLSALPVAALLQQRGLDLTVATSRSLFLSLSLAIFATYVQTTDYIKKAQDYLKPKSVNRASWPAVGAAGFFCVAVVLYSLTLLSEGSIWRWMFLVAASVIAALTVWLELKHIKLRRLELKA